MFKSTNQACATIETPMDTIKLNELKARIEKFPDNILDRFVLSKMYADHEMWDETIRESREILQRKPDYLVVHIQLGNALLQTNQRSEAKTILEKAKELAVTQRHMGMLPEIDGLLEQVNSIA